KLLSTKLTEEPQGINLVQWFQEARNLRAEIRQHNHQQAKKKMIDSFLNRKPTHIKMDKLLSKDPEGDAITDPNAIKNMA
ncbi:2719_t:CDS:2, partial [Acaulospora morrowiae]